MTLSPAPALVQTPRLQLIGGGTLAQTPDVLGKVGVSRVLIVTDPFMVSSGMITALTDTLAAAGVGFGVFSDTVPDPTDTVVEAGVAALQADSYDGIIGFGGGSPMDTAKAIAILAHSGGKMRQHKAPAQADMDALPVICIPTTAGTGSEVTRFTIITDVETDEKMLIMGLAALPTAAIVDYKLTMKKPFRLTADTGVDTLSHAVEAFVSRKATPVSDMYARAAMALVAQHLKTACFEPDNEQGREGMALAANLAGLAFSNASVALIHGMSRPIGAHFHVPHGLSNAMLFPAVTKFSLRGAEARYAEAARIMGWAAETDGDERASNKFVEGLIEQNTTLKVPGPEDWGIPQERFTQLMPLMAEQALASGSPNNNPVIPTAEQIVELYQLVWKGEVGEAA